MKLSTREDIDVPIDYAFARVSDFDALERRAMRNGVQVSRRDAGEVQIGAIWDIAFDFRGRHREVVAELTKLDPAQAIEVESNSDGLTALTQVELVALSKTRTRVMVGFELRAKTLTARLLLQSLKLAKGKMLARFKARVAELAATVEDDYRRGT